MGRFDLAAAVRVRRVTPGQPRTAGPGNGAEIDDGQAEAGAAKAPVFVDRIGSTTLPWIYTVANLQDCKMCAIV